MKRDEIVMEPEQATSADAMQEARRKLLALRQQQARDEAAPRALGAAEPPLSFGQEGLWFVDQLDGGAGHYHSVYAYALRGALDVARLAAAFDAIVERHHVLRSGLRARDDGSLFARLAEAASTSAPGMVSDAPGHLVDERAGLVQSWLDAQAREPFDLRTGPLLRARVMRLAPREHVLAVVVHHIAFDAWSLGVLMREVSALHAGEALPALPLQYGDYAAWQRRRAGGPRLERERRHWRERLGDLPALDLPTDRPRPAEPSHRGAVLRLPLPAAAPLKALAQRHDATLFMLLLAAFQVLLMRLSRQTDLAVGIPTAGRAQAELEGLIGYFVNSLVLRTDLDGDPSFVALLARVRRNALDAYAHAELPFDQLVAELRPQRDLSRHPLYDVSFDLRTGPAPAPRFEGIEAQPLPLHNGGAKFDLSLLVVEEQGGLAAVIEYASELFDAPSIERIGRSYARLLDAIVATPELPIGRLPLVDADEARRLVEAGEGRRESAPARPVLALLAEQVRLRPEAAAIVHGARSLSYRAFERRVATLAARLRALGVGPGVHVGVCLPRTMDLPAALFAVLEAGGVYLPLDPHDPPERRAFMREDCAASVVIAHRSLAATLGSPRPGEHLLWIDDDGTDEPAQTEHRASIDAEQPAYVIYTSGSTGRPKGVVVPHRGLAHHVQWLRATTALGPGDRVLHKTSIGFDASLVELVAPLACGATIVLADEHVERDAELLARTLADEHISIVQSVPSALRALLAEPGFDRCSALRWLISGGEALDRDLAREARRRLPVQARLGNFYGPTEASIDATFHEVTAADLEGTGSVSIGRPVAHARALVLDAHLQPVPEGTPGELCLGGAGLALGYLNRPELSTERFVPDPWHAGEKLYRTGDLVRRGAEGRLDFLGRIDQQVKLRGFRIELGEIEAALAACDSVREAAVVLRDDPPGHRRLVGYVVAHEAAPDEASHAQALREALRRDLPEHMLPAQLVRIEALPRMPSGKLDRRALPAPPAAAEARRGFVAPATPLEAQLAALWADALGLERVGRGDHFFDLGGHSLMAAQLIARVRREIEPRASLALLFRAPTLEAQAREIAALASSSDASAVAGELIALQPQGEGAALFCICGVHLYQKLAEALAPDHPVYGVFLPHEDRLLVAGAGAAPSLPSVHDMAADYLRAIRRRQPQGPYHLIGVSFGGLLAYEMAQRLRSQGEEVGSLTLIDYHVPRGARTWAQRVGGAWRKLRERGVRSLLERFRSRSIHEALRHHPELAFAVPEGSGDQRRLAEARDHVFLEASRGYAVRTYGGRMQLLRAHESLANHGHWIEPGYGWPRYVKHLRVIDLPGAHLTMLAEPHVQALARRMRETLAD